MKILLINDNSAHPNWGAQATPYALVRILERAIPDVSVDALSWDWLKRKHWIMHAPASKPVITKPENWGRMWRILRRFSEPIEFYPSVADDFDAYADAWLAGDGGPDGEEFTRLARDADAVVYNGENSIYRNTVEGCHGLFLLWFAKTRLGKPSALVNHTANLNDIRPIMNGMVRLVASVLDLVAARESCSLRNLHELGAKNAVLFPDVVFAEDPAEIATDAFEQWSYSVGLDDKPYFCLSASGLPMSTPRSQWHGAVGDLIMALRVLGLRAVLLARDPHCQFLGEVARRTESLYFGPEHTFTELWPLFQGAQFSITGHFHYMIIGASVGCPFIPLSNNNHKIRGACELLEWYRTTPFDATWLASCQSEIVAEAQWIVAERERLSKHLRGRSVVLRSEARALGERVGEIAGLRADAQRSVTEGMA